MTKAARILALAAFFLLAGCPTKKDPQPAPPSAFRWDQASISSIEAGGVRITERTAGYYVIGTCDGSDNSVTNVTSVGSTNGRLTSPSGACPGAPFSIDVTEISPTALEVHVSIGPLPRPYHLLSIPLDLAEEHAEAFRISEPGYHVGCGAQWERREAYGEAFATIPTPCPAIHDGLEGWIGVASTKRVVAWGEITGPWGVLRRSLLAGEYSSFWFVRNDPLRARNMELQFGALPAGAVVELRERIEIR